MNVQFIGFVTLLVGLIGLVKGPPFDIWAFLISLLFGAAAAVIFESLGSVNILPAHIMLGFLALGLVLRRGGLAQGLRTLAPGSAGFWFLWMVAYGVVSAFFMPRLFAGATEVFTVARGELRPGSVSCAARPRIRQCHADDLPDRRSRLLHGLHEHRCDAIGTSDNLPGYLVLRIS